MMLILYPKTIGIQATKFMKNSSLQRCKQGEIWLTKVAFEKSPNLWVRKVRPVLIVGNDKTIDTDLIIVPCTSQKARNEFDVLHDFCRLKAQPFQGWDERRCGSVSPL
jgi:hypothetical protein